MHDGQFADWWYEQEERAGMREDGSGADTNGSTRNEPPARFKFVTFAEALNMPPVEFLLEGILPVGGRSVLAGFSGSGKSVCAIGIGMSVAIGVAWSNLAVRQGPVHYIAAEGWHGFGQRLEAGRAYYGAPIDAPFFFLPAAPQMLDNGDVRALLNAMEPLPRPVLTIVDTLSQTFIGGVERDEGDIGRYMAGIGRIQREMKTHVMALHHTGWNQERERGSSATRANVDTLALITKEDNLVTLSCLKQKDAAEFSPIRLDMKPWASSVVLVHDPGGESGIPGRPTTLPETRRQALEALRDVDHGEGATATEWLRASRLAERTFHRAVKDLLRWEKITRAGQRRSFRYSVSEATP